LDFSKNYFFFFQNISDFFFKKLFREIRKIGQKSDINVTFMSKNAKLKKENLDLKSLQNLDFEKNYFFFFQNISDFFFKKLFREIRKIGQKSDINVTFMSKNAKYNIFIIYNGKL
jgi:hypothetical protein